MKTNKIIYWATTGITGIMMLLSAYSYIANPKIAAGFVHLGFPSYFRVELAMAKLIGALVLLIPQLPARVKEWAYAGFGITFISAAIAHSYSGDPIGIVVMPLIFLLVLAVSYVYYTKVYGTVKD